MTFTEVIYHFEPKQTGGVKRVFGVNEVPHDAQQPGNAFLKFAKKTEGQLDKVGIEKMTAQGRSAVYRFAKADVDGKKIDAHFLDKHVLELIGVGKEKTDQAIAKHQVLAQPLSLQNSLVPSGGTAVF
eukprot:TRINITY_DN5052_c0_g1_i1.p1 TRINITY_DN5052_c0_g1~~TRINITY_DN5052_c0_g1_i1.p1  ORF type:complete len:128 (+),score=26.94 TRINITY_DN5052_c0_g1_i1:82-465(+)